MDCVKSEKMI